MPSLQQKCTEQGETVSNRTNVVLYVLESQAEEVQDIFEQNFPYVKPDESGYTPGLIYFEFDDVMHGELHFLPELLKAGIAYDSCWEEADSYSEGTEHARFNEHGVLQVLSVNSEEKNLSLCVLMPLIDNPEKLKEYILKRQQEITPLSWDNQEEWGKRYLVMQLVK